MISFQQIDQLCSNHTLLIDSEQIFINYISDKPDHFNIWERAKNNEKNICNQIITQAQLAFKCSTCSKNTSHLICFQCFNIKNHENHNFFQTEDKGKCSCGQLTQMQVCETHQILNEQNLIQIEAIPLDLIEKIEQFIMTVSSIYHQVMNKVEIEWKNYCLPIMQLYHLCKKFNIDKIIQTIDNKMNYSDCYNLLVKSQCLHQIIFTFINWLTEDRDIFQNLVANILKKQLPNYNYSLYEALMVNQTLYETISPELPFSIGNLLQRLSQNSDFFEFMCKVNFKIFPSFYLLTQSTQTTTLNSIYNYIDLLNLQQDDIDPQYQENNIEEINELIVVVENYFKELQQMKPTSWGYTSSEYIQKFKECDSEILMKSIIDQIDQAQIFNFLENVHCVIHFPLGEILRYPWEAIKFFGSKFRNMKFDKFNMISLKNALGINYDKFKNQNIDLNIIKNFDFEKCLITKLINCFGKATSCVMPNKTFSYKFSHGEDIDLKDYIHFQGELIKEIENGIVSLFADSESNPQLQKNFISIILVQIYNLIKNKRNVGIKFETQLAQICSQYINEQDQFDVKQVKQRKIYMYLFKNASILDKLFVKFLCIHLSISDYQQSHFFLQFLQSIFDDSIEVIKDNFLQILQRCIQTYITVWMITDDKIDQMYYGYGENNYRTKLESIDIAFGKLYLFLFGEIGLLDIYRAINNMLALDISSLYIPTNLYLLRMITSDLDIYNSSIFYFGQQQLPKIHYQALKNILQNIMNIEGQATLQTIQLKFEDFGIQFPAQKHILKFLELNETTQLLKLKTQYPPLYDPILFQSREDQIKLFNQQLSERGISKKDLYFGNGLLWNIKQYHQENQYVIQKNLLNHVSSKQNLIDNLQFIQKYKIRENQSFIYIYNLFLAASYFRPEELKSNKIIILQILNQLFQDPEFQINKQQLAILIELFRTFSFLKDDEPSIKFQAKPEQQQCLIQDNELLSLLQNIKNQQCDGCKLQIQEKFSIPILISKKYNYQYMPMSETLNNQLINQNHNLLQISLNGCSHIYHPNCILLNQQSQLFFNSLPSWYKKGCNSCNHSFNISMPLNKSITLLEVQFFNKALVDSVNESGLWDYLIKSNQNQNQNIIIEIYLQIIIDLLQQLFIDINRFRDLKRTIVLNQLIYLFEQTIMIYKSSFQQVQPKVYHFDSQISILFSILNSIYNNIIITQNKQQLKKDLITIVLNLKYHQYKQTLQDVFNITDSEVQQFNDQSKIQIEESDPYIQYNQQIFEIYKEKLNFVLGQNFAEFHSKYLTKGCDICKNYNVQFEKSKDILVCLICEKVFCMKQCTNSKFGNLNEHAIQEHSGGSLYVSLITGQITLIQHPISLYSAYDLFYDEKFGFQKITSIEQGKWQSLLVNQQIIKTIIEIMIYNQYGIQIYNKKVNDNKNLTTDGGL